MKLKILFLFLTLTILARHRDPVMLSELGLLPAGAKHDVRIKHNAAVRYEDHYIPADPIKPQNMSADEINKHIERARALLKTVRESGAYTTMLDGKNISLPIGIKNKQVGEKEYTVCIDSIVLTPKYAYCVVYLVMTDLKNGKTLEFYARDIRFTRNGGFTGAARLELLQSYQMKMGSEISINFLVDSQHENYVVFDCNGFNRLHADVRIDFSRKIMIPDLNGEPDPNPESIVQMGVMADIIDFENWLVQVSNVPTFQIPGFTGFKWQIGTLAMDNSDLLNPSGMMYPKGFSSDLIVNNNPNLWQGFYARNLTVTMPEEFKLRSDAKKRISFNMPYGVIDKMGFTGAVNAFDLIPLSDGDMDGWNYSIDRISLEFVRNGLTAAAFQGQLILPVCNDIEVLRLDGSIGIERNYLFSVTTMTAINMNLFGVAQASIDKNSSITVQYFNRKFMPKAVLNGTILFAKAEVNGSTGSNMVSNLNNILNLKDIRFENLEIQTRSPYISVQKCVFNFPPKQRLLNLPVNLNQLGLENDAAGRLGLRVGLEINILGDKDPGSNSIGANFLVLSERNSKGKWTYYKTRIDSVGITLDVSSVYIAGYLKIYRDDPYYGSGFKAAMKVVMKTLNNAGFSSNVLFGKKTSSSESDGIFRYWYVDAQANLGSSRIALYPGVLYINAIGAGAYFRLDPSSEPTTSRFTTLNGVSYIPDENQGLGFKAIMGFEGPTAQVFNGMLGLEIAFEKGGAFRSVIFAGFAEILSLNSNSNIGNMTEAFAEFNDFTKKTSLESFTNKPSEANVFEKKMSGMLTCRWFMRYDHPSKTFDAINNIYINVLGAVKGGKGNNLAGTISFRASGKKWHLFVGTPPDPLELSIVGIVNPKAYVVMGHDIPAPLPLGELNCSFSSSTLENASAGKGFGIGVRITAEKPNIKLAIAKASIYGGAGADIYLANEGPVRCKGGAIRGVNNWYAGGQAGAFVTVIANWDFQVPDGFTFFCDDCEEVCLILCVKVCKPGCPRIKYKHVTDLICNSTFTLGADFQGVNPTFMNIHLPLGIGSIPFGQKCN